MTIMCQDFNHLLINTAEAGKPIIFEGIEPIVKYIEPLNDGWDIPLPIDEPNFFTSKIVQNGKRKKKKR